jgi:tetratricopeptide (TPR) repeat protein
MQKSQIIIVTLAIILIGGMYSLPKVLVSNKEKVLAAGNTAASKTPSANGTHTNNLLQTQVVVINKLRDNFLHATDQQKKRTFADSLAVVFRQASQYDSAAFYTEKIAELNPGVETWTKAGNAYYDAFSFSADGTKAGHMGEKARQYYEKVLEKDPSQLTVKANMAMTYVATASPMQGIMMLQEILKADPQNELAIFNLGLLSMQSGQYDKAIGRFEQILKQNPGNDQAKFYLGVSHAEAGHAAQAKKILKEVKASNQDPVVQTTVDEYLKKLK